MTSLLVVWNTVVQQGWSDGAFWVYHCTLLSTHHFDHKNSLIMKKRKNTEFYLLRKKSLSEADLFVTDYIKTKQRLENLESEFVTLQTFVRNQEIYFNDKKKH